MPGHRDLRRHHDFTVLWIGQTASELGTCVSMFAVPLIGFALTGSTLLAGAGEAAQLAGLALSVMPAGVLADRVDRRRIMRASAGLGLLAYASLAIAGLLGELTYPHLATAAFVAGVCEGWFVPAETAAVRSVVPRELLPTAMSQNQARQHVASLLGGPLAGLLYGLSRTLPFCFDAISFAVSFVLLGRLRADLRPPAAPDSVAARRPLRQVRDGLVHCWSQPFLRTSAVFSPCVNLTVNAVFILATLRLVADGTPPIVIGLVSTAAGVAGVAGAVVAPWVIERVPTGMLAVVTAWRFPPALLLMVFTGSPWAVAVAVVVVLLPNPAGNASMASYRIAITPDEMQGRVTSTMQFLSFVTLPFAALLGAGLLSALGGPLAVGVLAVVSGLVALIPTLSRSVKSVPRPVEWPEEVVESPDESAARRPSSVTTMGACPKATASTSSPASSTAP